MQAVLEAFFVFSFERALDSLATAGQTFLDHVPHLEEASAPVSYSVRSHLLQLHE